VRTIYIKAGYQKNPHYWAIKLSKSSSIETIEGHQPQAIVKGDTQIGGLTITTPERSHVVISNLQGQQIHQFTSGANVTTHIPSLVKGIYLVTIQHGASSVTYKVGL
jgi:hypothetical protein